MKKMRALFVIYLLLLVGFAVPSWAQSFPNIEPALQAWQGEKEVQITGDKNDPLASDLLPLIEVFLKHGFAVRTTSDVGMTKGLNAELRSTAGETMIVLKRNSDQAIIALDHIRSKSENATSSAASEVPATARTLSSTAHNRPTNASRHASRHAPIALETKPVALVQADPEKNIFALLSTQGIMLIQLQGTHLRTIARRPPPQDNFRPLTLSSGDLNGDGHFELAATWAEDIHGIYEGTDSRIWTQFLEVQRDKLQLLALQPGYVRLFPSSGAAQQRGSFNAFSGPVVSLEFNKGRVKTGKPAPWAGRNLFDLTPFNNQYAFVWLEPGKSGTISLADKKVHGRLLEDFGTSPLTQVAVKLEDPVFRSGFAKEDRIMETYVELPPRTLRLGSAILTIQHGRKPDSFLRGAAEGTDRLARIRMKGEETLLDHPYPAVEAFILDFAPVPDKNEEMLLLLNEKNDGSGRAFMLYQEKKP